MEVKKEKKRIFDKKKGNKQHYTTTKKQNLVLKECQFYCAFFNVLVFFAEITTYTYISS